MKAEERFLIVQEIADLITRHWHDVDRNWGRNAHNDYTVDGRSAKLKTTARRGVEIFPTGWSQPPSWPGLSRPSTSCFAGKWWVPAKAGMTPLPAKWKELPPG